MQMAVFGVVSAWSGRMFERQFCTLLKCYRAGSNRAESFVRILRIYSMMA